jgi:patatin-like phospholipase/acyl hydrolase
MITEVMMKTKLLNRFIITEKEAQQQCWAFFYLHTNTGEQLKEKIATTRNYFYICNLK